VSSRNQPTAKYVRFGGLRDANPDYEIGLRALAKADNVDITRNLKVRRRAGYEQVFDGATAAVWGDGRTLLFTTAAGELRNLSGGLGSFDYGPGSYLHAVELPNGFIALTTGLETRVLDGNLLRRFGVPVPPAPVVSVGSGSLRAGTYMVSVSLMGHSEGGLSAATVVGVSEGTSLTITPQVPVGYVGLVYCSAPDGEVQMLRGIVETGETLVIDGWAQREGSRTHRTHGRGVPPIPARTLAVSGSRLLYAEGNVLRYSDPLSYELFDLRYGWKLFPDPVTMIAPMRSGTFVGTEKRIVYLAGQDIASASSMERADYGVPLCQPVLLEAGEHGLENVQGRVSVWLAENGFVVGTDEGEMFNLSLGAVRFTPGVEGSLAVRRLDGQTHVVAAVRY
jgi:hypothetical protein